MLVLSFKKNERAFIFDKRCNEDHPCMSVRNPMILKIIPPENVRGSIDIETVSHDQGITETYYLHQDQWRYPWLKIVYLDQHSNQYKVGFEANQNYKILREKVFARDYPRQYEAVIKND